MENKSNQDRVWKVLVDKYEEQNSELEEKKLRLQNDLDAMKKNQLDAILCSCGEPECVCEKPDGCSHGKEPIIEKVCKCGEPECPCEKPNGCSDNKEEGNEKPCECGEPECPCETADGCANSNPPVEEKCECDESNGCYEKVCKCGEPDCTCTKPNSCGGEREKLEKDSTCQCKSLYSVDSADVECMKKILELKEHGYKLNTEIETLEKKDATGACKCSKKSGKVDNHQIQKKMDEIRMELKRCMDRVDGSIVLELEEKKMTTQRLQQQISKLAASVQKTHVEMEKAIIAMKTEFSCACANI